MLQASGLRLGIAAICTTSSKIQGWLGLSLNPTKILNRTVLRPCLRNQDMFM